MLYLFSNRILHSVKIMLYNVRFYRHAFKWSAGLTHPRPQNPQNSPEASLSSTMGIFIGHQKEAGLDEK